MNINTLKKMSLFLFFIGLSLLFRCTALPTNPYDPKNTKIQVVVEVSPTLTQLGNSKFVDTLGAKFKVGIYSNLPSNFDSATIFLKSNNSSQDTAVTFFAFTDKKSTDTFWLSYTLRDTGTATVTATVGVKTIGLLKDSITLTVYAKVNTPPRILVSGNTSISAGQLCSLSVVANDPDPNQSLRYEAIGAPAGSSLDSAGNFFKWTPAPGDVGNRTVVFKVTDNGFPPKSDSQTVIIQVTGSKINRAPKWQKDTINLVDTVGSTIKLTLSTICSDSDGNALSYTLVSGKPSTDTIIGDVYSIAPSLADVGIFQPYIIVKDSLGLSDTLTVNLTILSNNRKPVLSVTGKRSVKSGTACVLTASAIDQDSNQSLAYSVLRKPAGSTFDAIAHILTWPTPASFKGIDTAIFTVIDNGVPAMADTVIVQISVSDTIVNHPPKWQSDTIVLSTSVGNTLTLTLSDKCIDPDGDALTFNLLPGKPNGDTIKTGMYFFTPKQADTLVFWPKIIAKNMSDLSDTVTLKLTVGMGDKTPPYLKMLTPPADSAIVGTSSTSVKIIARDSSGIGSIKCMMGTDTFAVSNADSVYSATVTGLKSSGFSEILFIAIDKSVSANRDTLKVHIKYDPSVGDNVPPTLYFVKPKKDTVIGADSFAVQVICKDDSKISSVVATRDSTVFSLTKSATIDSLWSGIAKGLKASQYSTITVVATDSSMARNKATASVRIKFDNDVTGPTIAFVTPSTNSVATNASSYTITVQVTDVSGVLSVNGALGATVFSGVHSAGNNWTIIVMGLAVTTNSLIITATDSSLRANKSLDTISIKYDPTMQDTIGPNIIQKSGPSSNATITDPLVTIVDSIIDPSGVDSAYWKLNNGPMKLMTKSAGKFTLIDSVKREGLDTLVVTATDSASRHNSSKQVIVLTFSIPPKITTQPVSATVCSGATPNFAVTATGSGTLSYQWRSGATNPSNLNSQTNPSYAPSTAMGGQTVLSCVVKNPRGDSVVSNLCTLTVNTPPTITGPTNQTTCTGTNATVSVTAPGATAFQWFKGTPGSGTALTGANSASYATSTAGSYYCIVTGSGCSATSTAATVTVNNPPTIAGPTNQTTCAGTNATVSVTAPGATSFQWYSGTPGSGTALTGETSASYPTSTAGSYYCVVTGSGCSATSSAATVTAYTAPTVTGPTGQSVCPGNNANLSVSATGATVTGYQWYSGNTPGSGTAISGQTSNSYSALAGSYWCKVSYGSGCSVNSSAATVIVNAAPANPTTTNPAAICPSGSVNLTSYVTNSPTSGYSWVWYNTNQSTKLTSTTVSPSGTTIYYVRAEGGPCGNSGWGAVTVTVNAVPANPTTTNPAAICPSGSVNLTSCVTNSPTSGYNWVWYNTNQSTKLTSTTVSPSGTTIYYVRAEGGPCGNSDWAAVTVTVYTTPTITISGGGPFCYGGSTILSVSVSGSSITHYQWYNQSGIISGATSSVYPTSFTGTYYCVCTTSDGCSFNSPSTSVSIQTISVSSILGNIAACENTQVQVPVVASCVASSYAWFVDYGNGVGATPITSDGMFYTITNDGTLIIPYFSSGIHSGYYYCTVTDYYNHTATTNTCHISVATSGCH